MYSTSERIFNSIMAIIKHILAHINFPLGVGVIAFVIILVALKIKYKKEFKSKFNFKKVCMYTLSIMYFAFLIEITLLQRIGIEQEPPFSQIWTGWSIFETEMKMFVNSGPIINMLMMTPMVLITIYPLNIKKKRITTTALLSFSTSLIIEICQILFRLGTFQISDLVYNTLGGIIGALLFTTIIRYKKRKCN